MRRNFIRRSLLYVPGSSAKMLEKAAGIAADGIILDLEDSVSPPEKDAARAAVCMYISRIKETGKELIIRVNSMDTEFGVKDIQAVTPHGPDALIIPKADEAAVVTADMILTGIEQVMRMERNGIKLVPLLETAYSIQNAYAILRASTRVNGVQFGAEDLTKELGIEKTRDGNELRHARGVLVYAGKSLGIDVIDTPFPDIKDDEGLIAETNYSRSVGMTGKTCIHPGQVSIVNDLFTPGAAEVEHARSLVEAFEASVKEGKGACNFQGKMIDAPIADRARKLIQKAEMINNYNNL